MEKKIEKENLDNKNLNKVIKRSKDVLNVLYLIGIIVLLILLSRLFIEYKIFKILGEILSVISPLFIGFIIAWLIDPFIKKIIKISNNKIPRFVSSIIAYLVVIGIIIAMIVIISPQLASQIKDFAGNVPYILNDIKEWINNLFKTLSVNGLNTKEISAEITKKVIKITQSSTSEIANFMLQAGTGTINVLAKIILGVMVAFYLSLTFDKLNGKVEKKLPESWRDNYKELIKRINTSLRGYVGGVLIIMVLVFITQLIGFSMIGLEAPIIFAMFCAITDIIPYFGPYIGAIPAVIVGFAESPIVGVMTILVIFICQQLENNIYQPIIMGKAMKLHPIVIMLGLLLFGHFFGILGMIIATPVIATIKVIYDFIKEQRKEIEVTEDDDKTKENFIEKITNIVDGNIESE
jgi:predicted PurR-regulated permease PerM